MIGGKLSSYEENLTCERYDILNDKWEQVANLLSSAFSMSVLLQDRQLFVFGGNNYDFSVQQYSIASDTWTMTKFPLVKMTV